MQHNLDRAITVAQSLRSALDAEVARAQGERVLIRNFDVEGLFRRAGLRESWNAEVVRLQRALADELRLVGQGWSLDEITLEALSVHAPAPAAQLSDLLAQVRALAGALSELDELNRKLAQKATACVKGYLQALAVSAGQGYDRRGTAPVVTGTTYSGTA